MKKIFYFDVETTGLDAKKHDIVQLAYIIGIDGEVKETGNFELQPFDYGSINPEALKISNRTIEDLKTYVKPRDVYLKLSKVLAKYVDKYNKQDKFIPAGYNVNFDLQFLREFWFKNGDKYFGSFFDYHFLDVFTLCYILHYKGILQLENYKLKTVAKYFNINFDAHDALEDIRTTRIIFQKLLQYIK